ncbi:methyltransferase domain-containing protein [Pacificoceanicola onchidii]|uniref:methyltransferase domain-containing protein n=1 Tax=Pacificoceanicola onchidii TaxID=2562685 RepID=UPI0010A66817|nr:methyltransferase domain-containing protein [Pacificoceanicola onchidii]
MSQPLPLTDRKALIRNRTRVSDPAALFLHEMARDDVHDRLALVNKDFTDPAIVTPFPAIWQEDFPEARIISDEETLGLDEAAHDLIVHALALHWANDPVGQLIQCRRALRPDGLLLCLTFGGETLHELRSALATAEADITGGLSPRVLPMGEIRDLGAVMQRAGLAMPVADSLSLNTSYETPLHLMRELRAMGEANALSGRLRHPTRRSILMKAAQLYVEQHAGPDGRIPATFDIITLTGWAPDDSQPKPLRPGSATQSLAEALGTEETPLKD